MDQDRYATSIVAKYLDTATVKVSTKFYKIFQTLEEVQEHTLFFIKVGQFTMAHMFQDQLLNTVQKVSTIQHALQECL